jgi:cellulose synthase operon protein C
LMVNSYRHQFKSSANQLRWDGLPTSHSRFRFFWIVAAIAAVGSTQAGAKTEASNVVREDKQPQKFLYYEESGGLLTTPKKPVAGSVRQALPPLPPGKSGATNLLPRQPGALAGKSAPIQAPKATPATSTPTATAQAGLRTKRPAAKPIVPAAEVLAGTQKPAQVIPEQAAPAVPAIATRPDYSQIVERIATDNVTADARATRLEDAVGPETVQYKDTKTALRIGWLWLEGDAPLKAEQWFSRADNWSPNDNDAVRGLALAALSQRKFDTALAFADRLPHDLAAASDIRREALIGLGVQSYQANNFAAAVNLFDRASDLGATPRYVQMMGSWGLLKAGLPRRAAEKFAKLYRESPDMESAQGLIAASSQARLAVAADVSATEPLGTIVRKRDAEGAFQSKRILTARSLDPETWGEVGASGMLGATSAVASRDKSGEAGLGRLRVEVRPSIGLTLPVGARSFATASVDQMQLVTGERSATAAFGSFPLAASPAVERPSSLTVQEATIGVKSEREVSIAVQAGAITRGSVVGSDLHGNVELASTAAWGQWNARAYVQPIRESALSWAGANDPYSGSAWGGVKRTGGELQALYLGMAPFSVGVNARAESLSGTQVMKNVRRAVAMSLGRDLALPGFAYSSASLGIGSDRYEKNLNHYTIGHGGYFSPQSYRKTTLAFDFMTEEAKPWLVQGRAEVARAAKREDASPFFPLKPDGREYAGASGKANESSLRLSAVAQLTPHIQGGVVLSRNTATQYSERVALLELRVTFDRRRSVVSADLPRFRGT